MGEYMEIELDCAVVELNGKDAKPPSVTRL